MVAVVAAFLSLLANVDTIATLTDVRCVWRHWETCRSVHVWMLPGLLQCFLVKSGFLFFCLANDFEIYGHPFIYGPATATEQCVGVRGVDGLLGCGANVAWMLPSEQPCLGPSTTLPTRARHTATVGRPGIVGG